MPIRLPDNPGSPRRRAAVTCRSGACLLALVLAASAQADPLFSTPALSFPSGSWPHAVAIGDFDLDGRPDLAVANTGSNTVSVLLGNGDGSFPARTEYATGSEPEALAIADLDADGAQDLVLANYDSGTVSVLLGNGDGTFAARTDVPTWHGPLAIAVADLDGDGRQDVVVVNREGPRLTDERGRLSVLLGNGDGTFASWTELGWWAAPRGVAIADLNGDGRPDLAVAHFTDYSYYDPDNPSYPGEVSVLLGNGDGTFGPKTDYYTGEVSRSVAIADLDADGRPDLAVVNVVSSTVSVLLGNGDGSFAPKTDFGTASLPYSLAIADLDLDGTQDLAVTTLDANAVSVMLGNGDGTLGPGTGFGVGAYPFSVAVADLDSDGRPDLAVANRNSHTVSVLLGRGTVATPVPVPLAPQFALEGFRPNPAVGAPTVAFTLTDDSPATIDVLDIAGRRVLQREVRGVGVGRHAIRLDGAAGLAPGVYMVRLRQSGRIQHARGVVVR